MFNCSLVWRCVGSTQLHSTLTHPPYIGLYCNVIINLVISVISAGPRRGAHHGVCPAVPPRKQPAVCRTRRHQAAASRKGKSAWGRTHPVGYIRLYTGWIRLYTVVYGCIYQLVMQHIPMRKQHDSVGVLVDTYQKQERTTRPSSDSTNALPAHVLPSSPSPPPIPPLA